MKEKKKIRSLKTHTSARGGVFFPIDLPTDFFLLITWRADARKMLDHLQNTGSKFCRVMNMFGGLHQHHRSSAIACTMSP
jgi:hypothetical protein